MRRKKTTQTAFNFRHLLIPLLLLLGSYLFYKFIYPQPRIWYDHYLFLAKAFLAGQVDVVGLPEFYHDTIRIGGKVLLPFPPGPSLTLIPFLLFFPQISQQTVSVLLGATNVALIYLLLSKFTRKKEATLLTLFYALGTVALWSTVIGTTWYFGHTTAIFYLCLALILHFAKKDLPAGFFFALAVLCRYPVFLGVIYFVLSLYKKPKRLFSFLLGGGLLIPLQLFYSYARFGSIIKTGYYEVYLQYLNTSFPQTILQIIRPNRPVFGYLDIRNIPLHLFTALLMPPLLSNYKLVPSPYGMGILFTSPLLLYVFLKPFLKKAKWLFVGAGAIALVNFLHYMQGWVQFGYRFLLDFLPFLLIILAQKFKVSKISLTLLVVSIVVNVWGTLQGIKLGW